jgi:hypothetical protein
MDYQCSHPKCSAYWDTQNKVIVLKPNGSYARGLIATLNSYFYPEFLPHRKGKPRGYSNGKQIGILIDSQLSAWVDKKQYPKKPHEYFTAIVKELEYKQWIPIRTQKAVGCNSLRLGTMVDIECKNQQGQIILLEIKTGFEGYFDNRTDAKMEQPFEKIPTCYHYIHLLQLWFTTWLYKHNSPNEEVFSYIIRVFTGETKEVEVCVYGLPKWLSNQNTALNSALELLQTNIAETKKKRLKNIRNGNRRIKRRKII